MIYISVSMYIEAQPFVKKLNLKKDFRFKKFEVFKSNEVILIITGVGKIKSAIALTYLFSKYEIKSSDLFINIGVAGSIDKNILIVSLFICNKIIDNDKNKTFYPDMILKHPFKETSIETFSSIVDKSNLNIKGILIDMEAAGLYQAALVFMEPHQIIFIKIVSDYLDTKDLTIKHISNLVDEKSLQIIRFINDIKDVFYYDNEVLSKEDIKALDILTQNLKLSVTMGNRLKQLFTYYKLQNGDFLESIDKYISLECKSKNEGKRYFDKLTEKII